MMFGIPAQFCSLFVRYSCLYFCRIRAYCQLLVLKNEKLKKRRQGLKKTKSPLICFMWVKQVSLSIPSLTESYKLSLRSQYASEFHYKILFSASTQGQ